MKKLLILSALIMAGLLALGCAPSDTAPPAAEATPTPAEKIQDMDFESGEAEQAEEVAEETAEEAEPDGQ
jgi:PBP1b-binding outer membrane lipoprotein LpoB